jgi:hypothetical protein
MNRRDFLRHAALAAALGAAAPLWGEDAPAAGRQFYFDDVHGNDGASGASPQQAWRSVAKFNATRFQPGDRIYFRRGGSFPGQLRPQGSGSAGRPIVVDAYGSGAPPHIHAYGKAPCSVYLHNVEYWTLRNLQVSNKGPQDQPNRAGVYVHHEDFGVARGIVLDRLYVHDVNGSPVKKRGGGAGILVNATGKRVATRYEGLAITGCSVVDTQRNGIAFLAAGSRQGGLGKGVVVRGNRVQRVPGDCILVAGCDGAVVERNTVSQCTALPPGEAAAGIWPFNCDNTLVQYNEVSGHQAHADGQGFDIDLACRNTVLQYNYSHDNVGGLALVCNLGGKNLGAGNTGSVVRYNVSINDALRAAGGALLRVTGPVEGSEIYNNLVIVPRRPSGPGQVVAFRADDWKGAPSGTAIHDNLILAEQTPGIAMQLDRSSRVAANTVYGAAGAPAPDTAALHFRGAAASRLDPRLLDKFRSYRPSLDEAVALVKQCFPGGKAAPDALALIQKAAGLG